MAVRLEDVAKASECHSISRAGRMTESLAVRASVSLTPKAKHRSGGRGLMIDMTMLEDAPRTQEDTTLTREKELCSSSRVHPETQQRLEESHNAMKEQAFLKSVSQFRAASPVTQSVPRQKVMPSETTPAHSQNKSSPSKQRRKQPSAAFLAVERNRFAPDPSHNPPPVGHYNPRTKIVETNAVAVSFTKAKREFGTDPPPIAPPSEHTPTKRAKGSSSDGSFQNEAAETTPSRLKARPTTMSPCFLTVERNRSPHRSPTAHGYEPTIANDRLVMKYSQGFDMSRQVGRNLEYTRPAPRDMNGATPPAKHTPGIDLARLSPRPLGSSTPQLEKSELNISNFEKFKFAGSHTPDIAKSGKWRASKTQMMSRPSELAEVATPDRRHLPNVNIAAMVGRRDLQTKASEVPLEYNVSYEAVSPHASSVLFAKATVSPMKNKVTPTSPPPGRHADDSGAPVDSSPVRRKLAQDIVFAHALSRDAASKSGRTPHREALCTESELRPLTEGFADHCRGGDPRMQTHIDREARNRQRSPLSCAPDKSYDVTLGPVSHGYVEFGKMVSRDRHHGSHFSNA